MFLGHYGVALAAKRIAPQASLGTFFLAAQFADLLWPNLVLAGVEVVRIKPGHTAVTPLEFVHYPYSHSLVAMLLWGGLVALIARSAVAGLLVLSHWFLDWIVHVPDLPLAFGNSPEFGLGVWNSRPATALVEFAILAAGVLLYVRSTRARDRIGSIGFWALILFLALTMIANLFGPPPPSAKAVAITAQAMWLLVAWGYWVDRHRIRRAAPAPSEPPASR